MGAASYHEDVFTNEVKAGNARRFPFVEVAADGVADVIPKLIEIIAFREDRLAEGAGCIASLWRLGNQEDYLVQAHDLRCFPS